MPGFSILDHVRPGDHVTVGEAAAEPRELVAHLFAAAGELEPMTVLCGYSLNDAWRTVHPGRPAVKSYAAHGSLRKLAAAGALEILPCHISSLVRYIRDGTVPVDVVLVQLPPADEDGFHSLGPSIGYLGDAMDRARVILAEINPNVPKTASSRRIHRSRITAAIHSATPLPTSPSRPAGPAEKAIGATVAALVPDGASLQLGIGAVPGEIAGALRDRSGLRVRSALIGDWLLELVDSGALDVSVPGACATGIALGSRRLYDFIDHNPGVEFVAPGELLSPAALASCDPLVVVNSALQVDLYGQVNAEALGGRYLGAVGGQVDLFRAAHLAKSGLAVVALPATDPSGARSSIVPRLDGPTTSLQSDIDVVATEHGLADLRATTAAERARRLIAIAAPEHRDSLRA
ncbi:methyltransferase [Amycolatopsis sp. K13G38]|uniref:Methyltransferase n=1 Tax=Amycolatopsis acididurans TaxID=2724524 RepID=A0ABX1JAX3_9PSEU|nr:acetyl-CoA hydrolase/transferase C-terminal domain-containing protein [Amycolatopsis acididurans]NKQ55510.1 methyltransferase [Amycolatopsis acididurans]